VHERPLNRQSLTNYRAKRSEPCSVKYFHSVALIALPPFRSPPNPARLEIVASIG
jgi:hypothetical protein